MNKPKIELVDLAFITGKRSMIKVDGRYLLDGKTGGVVVVDGSNAARAVLALQKWEEMKCVS